MDQIDLPAHFDWFADWARGTAPLYETLASNVASDPELLSLAELVPPDRSPANVFFAAVHSVLLGGSGEGDDPANHPLATYYPTCVADGEEARDPDEEAFEQLQTFCAVHRDELVELLRTRRTQTNAVRRCTALLPAFEYVSRQVDDQPIALVEVGPSAGLNLCWNRYGYQYEWADSSTRGDDGVLESTVYGDSSSPARLSASLRGDAIPPLPEKPSSLPSVASRVGLDLNPLDVTDSDDVRWLLGLVWPEHTERHELLRAAIDVASDDPPELRAGDALNLLNGAVDEVPDDTPVCVFDTQVRYQFDEAMDERYRESIRDLGRDRELHWLTGHESVGDAEEGLWLEYVTVETGEADGEAELVETRIAAYQQHGRWLQWVASE